jgi:pantothenate synthetase
MENEEVEVKIPKKLAEELAKTLAQDKGVIFKPASEVLEEKKEQVNLEEIKKLKKELSKALNERDFARVSVLAKKLRKELEKKKKEMKGAEAPSWIYDVEAELGYAEEILSKAIALANA